LLWQKQIVLHQKRREAARNQELSDGGRTERSA
jgi:hypothetical protein